MACVIEVRILTGEVRKLSHTLWAIVLNGKDQTGHAGVWLPTVNAKPVELPLKESLVGPVFFEYARRQGARMQIRGI